MSAGIFVAEEKEGRREREREREWEMAEFPQNSQQAGTSRGQRHISARIITLSHSASRQRITSQPAAERRREHEERESERDDTHVHKHTHTHMRHICITRGQECVLHREHELSWPIFIM